MARTVTDKDGIASKVAKYVPAEMVTIATAYFAAFDPSTGWILPILLVGATANVLYLMSVAKNDKEKGRDPLARFYVLSALAFGLWSAAMIDEVAAFFHLTGSSSDAQRAFVLSATAFALPLLDSVPWQRGGKVTATAADQEPHQDPHVAPAPAVEAAGHGA